MASIYKQDGGSVKNLRQTWRALVRKRGVAESQNFPNKKDAEKWARLMEKQIEADYLAGRLDHRHAVKKVTIYEAVERRIERKNPATSTTARMRWWVEYFGPTKKIVDITRDDIERALSKLRRQGPLVAKRGQKAKPDATRGVSPSTQNRYLSSLGAVLQEHVNPIDGLPYNAAHAIDKPREPQRKHVILSPDERERLLVAAKLVQKPDTRKPTYERMYFLVISAMATGARRGELLGLKWSNVNVESGTAWLDAEQTKTKRPRQLTWTGPALEELRHWAKVDSNLRDGWLFPSPRDYDKPFCPSSQKVWNRVRREAGAPDGFRFHDLRHLCATYLARNGANAFAIMEILGHTSVSTTQIYVDREATPHHRQILEESLWSD